MKFRGVANFQDDSGLVMPWAAFLLVALLAAAGLAIDLGHHYVVRQ